MSKEPKVATYQDRFRVFEWSLPAAIAAPGTLSETAIGGLALAGQKPVTVVSLPPAPGYLLVGPPQALIFPSAALTSDPTNNVTITIFKRTAVAPGTAVPIAIGTTSPSGANATGDWTAFVPIPLVTQDVGGGRGSASILATDVLTISITPSGTGVLVPKFALMGFTVFG